MSHTQTVPGRTGTTDPLRILPIVARLLPGEVLDSRSDRRVKRVVIAALAVVALLLAGWYAVTRQQTAAVREELTTAQRDADRLQVKQRDFDALVAAQSQSTSITGKLSSLRQRDVYYSGLLADVTGAAPAGVQLVSLSVEVSATGTGVGTGATLPSAAKRPIVGSVAVTGTGNSKVAIAAYLDALAKVAGLANPELSSAVTQDTGIHFTLRVDVTAERVVQRSAPTTAPGGN